MLIRVFVSILIILGIFVVGALGRTMFRQIKINPSEVGEPNSQSSVELIANA